MGYTHYFSAKNPVKDLIVNNKATEEIWYKSAASQERKELMQKQIEDPEVTIKRMKKHLAAFEKIAADAQKLYENLPKHTATAGGYHLNDPLEIKGTGGKGEPIITPELIAFNGNEELGLDHETFLLAPFELSGFGNFCKTARKPYDVLAVACILAAKKHLGAEFTFSSDGNMDELKEGIELYETVLKRKVQKSWFKKFSDAKEFFKTPNMLGITNN